MSWGHVLLHGVSLRAFLSREYQKHTRLGKRSQSSSLPLLCSLEALVRGRIYQTNPYTSLKHDFKIIFKIISGHTQGYNKQHSTKIRFESKEFGPNPNLAGETFGHPHSNPNPNPNRPCDIPIVMAIVMKSRLLINE